jgi:hypothetical protein
MQHRRSYPRQAPKPSEESGKKEVAFFLGSS